VLGCATDHASDQKMLSGLTELPSALTVLPLAIRGGEAHEN
jgi:hypothetical protein